jgi:hypothetical protein
MATITLQAELTPQLVSQASPSMSEEELAQIERIVQAERRRRHITANAGVLSATESRLFSIINDPLPETDELLVLRADLENETLTEAGQLRLMELEDELESVWAEKLRAVSELADFRGVDFDKLYEDLQLNLRAKR